MFQTNSFDVLEYKTNFKTHICYDKLPNLCDLVMKTAQSNR